MNLLRAEDYLRHYSHVAHLSEVYDDDEMLQMALSVLFPGFEYPDISHLSLKELWTRYQRNPQPLGSVPADAGS